MGRKWLGADVDGLEKIARRRGLSYVLFELLQNCWDTQATHVQIAFHPAEGRARVAVTCVDDDPEGFQDLTHAHTLFAPSVKKGFAEKRGRFNLGEKLVLAVCEEAHVHSTKGKVTFHPDGEATTSPRTKRERGTEFYGLVKMTCPELAEVLVQAELLIPPRNVRTVLNGQVIPIREPTAFFLATLATEIGDEDGTLRSSRRQCQVRVYEPLAGRGSWLYEMGLPIVEIEFPWSLEVMQKVPVTQDRANVSPAFLRELVVRAVNNLHTFLTPEGAALSTVTQTLGDERVNKLAAKAILDLTQGERRAVFDPTDVEAGHRLASEGYTILSSRSLPAGATKNLRALGVLQTAAEISPTPKPYSQDPNAPHRVLIPESDWTPGMRATAGYARTFGHAVIGLAPKVTFDAGKMNGCAACYGERELTFAVGTLGKAWFDEGPRVEIDDLLLHELSHSVESNHLSAKFHEACTQLGARLAENLRRGTMPFPAWAYGAKATAASPVAHPIKSPETIACAADEVHVGDHLFLAGETVRVDRVVREEPSSVEITCEGRTISWQKREILQLVTGRFSS